MNLKHEIVMPCDNVPFKIFEFEGGKGKYYVAKHWHGSIEIFSVLDGEIDFYINNSKYEMKKGSIILVNANEIHSIDAKNENKVIVLQIPENIWNNDQCILLSHLYGRNDKYVFDIIKAMYEKYNEGYENKFYVLGEFYHLLDYLIKNYQKEADEESIRQNKSLGKLSKITAYIEENYNRDISLYEVADKFGFSQTYLSRLFKKSANINYKSFVDSVRLEHAYKELLNTDNSICDIAYNNGFPNNKSFILAFKNQYHMTPSEYRKKIKNDKE